MISAGIVEKIPRSEWVHPMQTVAKPDPNDPTRITTDYSHGINKYILPVIHPTPRADDIFNSLRDCKVFSKLDMKSSYHHVTLNKDSRHLTAFITQSHGLLQYCRMPMGLTDAGAVFQIAVE